MSLLRAYAGLFCALAACALLTPPLVAGMLYLAKPVLRAMFGAVGAWAAGSASAALSRTAVATAALMLAIAAVTGIGVMVDSFRGSVATWLGSTLGADGYVSVPGMSVTSRGQSIAPAVVDALLNDPAVADASRYRWTEVEVVRQADREVAGPDSRSTFLVLESPEVVESFYSALRTDASASTVFAGEVHDPPTVLVTEPFAFRRQLAVGDVLTLQGDRAVEVRIGGVYRDYAMERGFMLCNAATWTSAFGAMPPVTTMTLQLDPSIAGDDSGAALRALNDRVGEVSDQEILIRGGREIEALSLEIFDRTFRVTDVLRLLCAIVAFLGVFGALSALQWERRREVAVLRAVGATRRQVWSSLTLQALLLGLGAGLLAVPVGLLLATLLIEVVNRQSFGWTLLASTWSPTLLIGAVAWSMLAAGLAGLWPAHRLAREVPAQALREE